MVKGKYYNLSEYTFLKHSQGHATDHFEHCKGEWLSLYLVAES